MNGVHDMGGMHGFGPVPVDDDTPFHDDVDRAIFALHMLARSHGVYNLDEFRLARERIAPAEYLRASYWERDLLGLEDLLVASGTVTEDELAAWYDAFDGQMPEAGDAALADDARAFFEADRFTAVEPVDPRYGPGEPVTVTNAHPAGHTRSPRYARGATGTVRKHYGTFHLPDAMAEGRAVAEPCYSVRFDAAELWGRDTSADTVCIDLWESYLERA